MCLHESCSCCGAEISWGEPRPPGPAGPGSAAGPGSQQQRELSFCRGKNLNINKYKINGSLMQSHGLNSACFLFQLEDKRAEMERQLISMKVQYQSLQKQYAFSKQQLQRMKVPWLTGHWTINTVCWFSNKLLTRWCSCAGSDSYANAAPGLQGRPCSAGETPVHAVGEERWDPDPHDQTAETGEGGGER